MSHRLAPPATIRYAAASTVLNVSDDLLVMTQTGQTVTLPSAIGARGDRYIVKNANVKNTTVACVQGQTLDGGATYVVGNAYGFVEVISDNANWLTC